VPIIFYTALQTPRSDRTRAFACLREAKFNIYPQQLSHYLVKNASPRPFPSNNLYLHRHCRSLQEHAYVCSFTHKMHLSTHPIHLPVKG
jgi:hypothetical protein